MGIDMNQKERVNILLWDMQKLIGTNFAWFEIQPLLEKRASELALACAAHSEEKEPLPEPPKEVQDNA